MKLLITTSTLPVSDLDEVPAFVKEQAIELKRYDSTLKIIIHAPHNSYGCTSASSKRNRFYEEIRFHYFWPFRFELLTGRGIMPALKANRLLYGQVPFLFIFQVLSLWRLVCKEKPDLLYAHWFTPQALSTALVSKLTGVPFVFTTHASDVSVLKRMPLSAKIVQMVCSRARAYSAVSSRTACRLQEFFRDDEWRGQYVQKLRIIPMGVTIGDSRATTASIERTRRRYSLDERPVLLYLGRMAEKKGITYLLEALPVLPEQLRGNLQLVIAGDGQLKRELEEKAEALNLRNVTFAGYVVGAEKDSLLAVAEILCLPSIVDSYGDSEGFPVVLMEGLAAGKILLASDVSGGEVILQDGVSGFLFKQKSSTDLAAALVRALTLADGEAQMLKEKSRELAKQFSWGVISAKYHRMLKDAADHAV